MVAPRPTILTLVTLLCAAPAAAGDAPAPVIVLDEQSPYQRVFVIDDGGQRFLRFDDPNGDDQSVIDPDHPEIPVLQYIPLTVAGLALAGGLERGAVIGFGAGTCTLVWHGLAPRMRIDSVDIDPVVAAVAVTHFGFVPDALLPIHVMDGRRFVRDLPPRALDVVLLDAYGSGDAPDHLVTLEFYRELRQRMAPGGVVMANMVADLDETLADQIRTFREAFQVVYRLETPTDGNVVLIGTDGPALGDEAFADALRAFCAERAPDMDLTSVARPLPMRPEVAGARVLHDRP